jgi:hypothetical protein
MEGGEMSDTPISDSTPHNVADLGMLCRRLERELNAANDRIKLMEEMYEGEIGENEQFLGSNLQGLLTRELNWSKDRIKRLEKWIACLNPIAQHSGQSENREWHGVDTGWLYPSQVVYLGEAKP